MKALTGTVAVSGIILFIIIGATTFSQVLSFSGVVNGLIAVVTGLGLSVDALVIAMLLILLFLGCFVDQVSMMLITLPFFMPLVARYNVDTSGSACSSSSACSLDCSRRHSGCCFSP